MLNYFPNHTRRIYLKSLQAAGFVTRRIQ